MTYRVVALGRAEADIQSIANYIFNHSPKGADSWLTAYEVAVAKLAEAAMSYGPAYENDHFEDEIKQLNFKTQYGRTYRILYLVVDDEARILRVRGPGQAPVKPEDLN